jgi:hypothetical protein
MPSTPQSLEDLPSSSADGQCAETLLRPSDSAAQELAELDALEAEADARAARQGQRPDPVEFARRAGFNPDAWQADVLRSDVDMLLNIARQMGKSTTVAYKAAYRAVFWPKSLILLVSPSDRQSGELFAKVREVFASLPASAVPKFLEDNKRSLKLANGSRIVSLPDSEARVRGFSGVNLLVFDESGDVPDALYRACRPMLIASRGQLICAGTPKGKRGWFWESWANQALKFTRLVFAAADNPRISAESLAQERVALGAAYAQEYECEFLAGVFGRVYGAWDLARNGWEKPNRDAAGTPWACDCYLLGIDYGFNDDCAFSVLGWRDNDPTVYILSSYKLAGLTPSDAAEEAAKLGKEYSFVRIVGDTGGLGKGYAEEARKRFSLPIEAADKTNKRGYIDLLNGALAKGLLKVNVVLCGGLIEEWHNLPWDDKRQKEAEGFANHESDACLYAWRACSNYRDEAPNKPPAWGTKEYWEAEEEGLIEGLEARLDAQRRAEWWNG